MSWSYDPTTDTGKVRLLISDTSAPPRAIFEDEELQTFLSLEAADDGTQYPRYAAAMALVTIAVSEVRLLKIIDVLDLKLDGTKVAASLQSLAKEYRDAENNRASFDWAETVVDDFAFRERIINSWLRNRQ